MRKTKNYNQLELENILDMILNGKNGILRQYKQQGNSIRNVLNEMNKACYSIKSCQDKPECVYIKTCKNIDSYNFLEIDRHLAELFNAQLNERIDNLDHKAGPLTENTASSCIRRLNSVGKRIVEYLSINGEVKAELELALGREYENGFQFLKSIKQFDEYITEKPYIFPDERHVVEFLELIKNDVISNFIVCLMHYIGIGAQQICEIMPSDILKKGNKYYFSYGGSPGKIRNRVRFNPETTAAYEKYIDYLKERNKTIDSDRTLIRNKFGNDFNVRGIGNIIVKYRKKLQNDNSDITALILRDVGIARKFYYANSTLYKSEYKLDEYFRCTEVEYKKGQKLAKNDLGKIFKLTDITDVNKFHIDYESRDKHGNVMYYKNNSPFNIIRR